MLLCKRERHASTRSGITAYERLLAHNETTINDMRNQVEKQYCHREVNCFKYSTSEKLRKATLRGTAGIRHEAGHAVGLQSAMRGIIVVQKKPW